MKKDPKEKEIQAEIDYWENQVKQEEDDKLFASNMQLIQSMDDSERAAFEKYANNRTFVDPESLEAFKALKAKFGDKLQDLKVTYQRDKDEQAARAMAEKTSAKMEQGGVLADIGRNVLSVGANLVGGVTGTAGRINEIFNGTGPYQTAAKYTAGDIPSVYGQTVRDKTTEQILNGQNINLDDGISGREIGALAYQGGMGALDSGARLAASLGNPFVAAGLAASQSFSSTVQEATEKGASPEEAYTMATVSAGIETLTEKLPLDNLMDIAKGGANPKVILNLLLQAGIEIGEEEASLIGNTLAEAAILREKSDYQQRIQKAAAMGVPYEQAVAEADRALLEEAKQTALVSGFSGLLSAGGAEIANRKTSIGKTQQETTQQPETAQQEQTLNQTEQAAQPSQTAQEAERTNWMEQTFRELDAQRNSDKNRQQQAYEAVKAEQRKVNQLEKDIAKAEQKLKETAAPPPVETVATEIQTPTYEELAVKKDIPVIKVGGNTSGKTYQQMKADVLNMATMGRWFDEPYTNADTGMPVFLTNKSFSHSFNNLRSDFGTDTLLALENTPKLIENAVLVHTAQPKDLRKGESKVHTFMAAIEGENGTEPVKITVKEYANKPGNNPPKNILEYFRRKKESGGYNTMYDLKALEVVGIESAKNEFGASASAAGSLGQPGAKSTPNSTIRVTDLMGLVKGDAEKYIPKPAAVEQGSAPMADTSEQSAELGQAETTQQKQVSGKTKTSKLYTSTYPNATDENIRAAGENVLEEDPTISQYKAVTEQESMSEATQRTDTEEKRNAEYENLIAKEKWTGTDNDTAMNIIKAYQKEGKAEQLRELARKQREQATGAGQLIQSFAKYSREDATVAVLDAVETLDNMSISQVPKNVWKKAGKTSDSKTQATTEPTSKPVSDRIRKGQKVVASDRGNIGVVEGYDKETNTYTVKFTSKDGLTATRIMGADQISVLGAKGGARNAMVGINELEHEGTIQSKKGMQKQEFEAWKNDVTKSMMDIANQIESIPADDVESMRDVVRQLARFRRTTAMFGTKDSLAANAERILGKIDYGTAKTIAKAQLAMVPDDFRKRSAGEIAKTARIHNMLSALTTTNRNTVGNASMGIMDAFSDSTVARAMDTAISKFTGIRTVGNDMKYGKEYFNAARDAADMAALCVELNIPLESESMYSAGNTRTYSTQGGPVSRFLSAYEKYLKYSLEVTDKFFEGGANAAVTESIRGLGEKSGLTDKQIEGLSKATSERRTFKDKRAFSVGAGRIKEGANTVLNVGGVGLGDMLMPFSGVPANVAHVASDYSGSGIVTGVKDMIAVVKAAQNGEKTVWNANLKADIPIEQAQRKAVSDFGRSITGAGLIAFSTAAAAAGYLKVHNSEDWEEKGLEQSQGLSGAQINLSAIYRDLSGGSTEWQKGDVVFGMDFLQPFNSAMHIGYSLSQEPDIKAMIKNYPKHAFKGVMDSILDMPVMTMLSETQDLIDSLSQTSEEDGNAATVDALGQVAGTFSTSAVPSFVRQFAQTIDPYYRDTYDPNPIKQAGKQLQASIPFASMALPEKYDALGNVQKRYDDSTTAGKVIGALSNVFLPDKVKTLSGDEITAYLGQLADNTGEISMYPEEAAPYNITVRDEKNELTAEQRSTYQKTYGEKNAELYGGLINYPGFKELPEDVQIEAFDKAKALSTKYAKASVADYRDLPQGTTDELVNNIVISSVGNTFDRAFSDMVESWDLDYDAGGAVQELNDAYDVYLSMPAAQMKEFKETASGRMKYYLDARSSGLTTEQFTDLYQKYRDVDSNADLTTTEKAHDWAEILETAVDNGEITEKQKNVMKDNLVYRYTMEAETTKFDTMIDSGLQTDKARDVIDIVAAAIGTGSWDIDAKKYSVREIDKREAIANSFLTTEEKDIAMKSYMSDYDPTAESPELTEVKYEYIRQQMGLTPEQYAETYRAYLDSSKKAEKIAAIEQLGYSESTAEALYYVYYGNQKKVGTVNWYKKNILK